jgi:predicted nucleotidyltransferase
VVNKEYILSEIKQHKAELHHRGVVNIGLFGSYASGKPSDHSDIDIYIEFDPAQETFDNYMAVYDLLEALFPHKKVEVVTKNGLSPYIGPQILRELVYV